MSTKRVASYRKTPSEAKDYTLDYSKWLSTGDTIASVTFAVTADGLVCTPVSPMQITSYQVNGNGTSVTYKAEDGDDGETYDVLVTATTASGQIEQDLIVFNIQSLQ
jgi:hypothetical protein